MSKAQISSITCYPKGNYVSYNDSDIMSDYFNAYHLGQKETCQWVKEDGADQIIIHVSNDSEDIPHLRRVKQICKTASYTYEVKSHLHTYWGGYQSWKIEYELKRVKPSTFVVLWDTQVDQDFYKSPVMNAQEKEDFIEDLRSQGVRKIIVKEFKE